MHVIHRINQIVDYAQLQSAWLPPLLARVATGWIFLWSGWGKLHSLEDVTQYFADLGIPAPGVQAPFIASLEFVGGVMLLAGLGTRGIAILLSCTMLVALMTALRDDIETPGDLFSTAEFLYIVLFVYLFVQGAGAVSVDYWARKRVELSRLS